MTDIDAIRKYVTAALEARSAHHCDIHADVLRGVLAALAAYDAMCEELAAVKAGGDESFRLAVFHQARADAAEVEHEALRASFTAACGENTAKHVRILDLEGERDAAHREKAAAMGLVEGHALTIAKLEAERDAAVREREGLRDALTMAERVIRPLVESEFGQKWVWPVSAEEQMMRNARESLAAIDAQLAALSRARP